MAKKMDDEKIKQMVLELIEYIDYDIYKEIINDECTENYTDLMIGCLEIVRKYL